MDIEDVVFGFFDSINNDRLYGASSIGEGYDGLFTNGILAVPSNQLQVVQNQNMNVLLKRGKGYIGANWIKLQNDKILNIDESDVVLDRIDRVVFYRDMNERKMDVKVLKGTPSLNPVPPEITRNDIIYEMSLATIYIKKQQIQITDSSITDTRMDNEVCGFVTGVNQVDTTTLYNQYQASLSEFESEKKNEYDSWFTEIKTQIETATILKEYNILYTILEEKQDFDINVPGFLVDIDIISVYVNGIKLIPNVEFTYDNTMVHLNLPLTEQNTKLLIVVQKNVNGLKK